MGAHEHVTLLVEDNEDAREAFAMVLRSRGLDVVGAHDGAEAFRLLRGGGLKCCLIVLDWSLPDMDGGQFMRTLNADPALAGTPVAMCTGDGRVRDQAEALGVKCVLVKPLDPDRLVALVTDHCAQRPDAA